MKKILFIILMLFAINVNAQFKLSQYPDSVVTLNDSSFFDVSRYNGPGSFTSSKMRALRLPPFILKGWAFNPVDSAFYPIVSGKNIGTDTNRIDTVFMNSVFDYKNTSDLIFWNGTTRMIIKSDGKIGIGAINPVGLLAIKDDSTYIDRDAEKNLTFTDSVTGTKTLAELAAGGVASDSSFVVVRKDTNKAFNNTNIQTVDSSIFQEHLQTNKSFEVNGGLSLFKGIDATSFNFAGRFTDNVDTDLLVIRNDGNTGIGDSDPAYKLTVRGDSVYIRILNSAGVTHAYMQSHSIDGGRFELRDLAGVKKVAFGSTFYGVDFINTGFALGVGTDLPIAKFHVQTSQAMNLAIFEQTGSTNSIIKIISPDAAKPSIIFGDATANRAKIESEITDNLIFFTSGVTNNPLELTGSGNALLVQSSGNVGIGTATPSEKLDVNGNAIIDSTLSTTRRTTTLGIAATTFPVFSNVMTITGDGGANTITTITGANSGQYLILIFVDGLVTLTDDNGHGANTLDLSAAFTSADDTIIHLIYDGISWYEISRSTN